MTKKCQELKLLHLHKIFTISSEFMSVNSSCLISILQSRCKWKYDLSPISVEQTKNKDLKSEKNYVLLVWGVPLIRSLPNIVFLPQVRHGFQVPVKGSVKLLLC